MKKWNKTKEDVVAEFRVVCDEMRKVNEEKAPMNVCVALGKQFGYLMGVLMNDFGMSREELLEISDGVVD